MARDIGLVKEAFVAPRLHDFIVDGRARDRERAGQTSSTSIAYGS